MQIFNIGLASSFYALFLPGGSLSGGPIRWYKLSQPDKMPAQALVSIVFNRIVHITSLAAIGFLFWILDPSLKKSSGAGLILVGATTLLISFHFLTLSKRMSSFIEKVFERSHFIPSWVREKTKKIFSSARQTQSLSPKSWFSIWIFSFVGEAFGIYAFYLLSLALHMEINWIHWAWIRSVVILLTLLPLSIAGIGIREAGLVLLLTPFGIEATSAVAYSFLMFTLIVMMAGLGGLIEAKNFLFPDKSNPQIREVSES